MNIFYFLSRIYNSFAELLLIEEQKSWSRKCNLLFLNKTFFKCVAFIMLEMHLANDSSHGVVQFSWLKMRSLRYWRVQLSSSHLMAS